MFLHIIVPKIIMAWCVSSSGNISPLSRYGFEFVMVFYGVMTSIMVS